MRSSFALLAAAALFVSCGEEPAGNGKAEKPMSTGERIYQQHCVICHGEQGGLMMGGAKDLRVSTIKSDEAVAIITNGRNNMMPYKNVLKPEEINAVVHHVLTLRTAK